MLPVQSLYGLHQKLSVFPGNISSQHHLFCVLCMWRTQGPKNNQQRLLDALHPWCSWRGKKRTKRPDLVCPGLAHCGLATATLCTSSYKNYFYQAPTLENAYTHRYRNNNRTLSVIKIFSLLSLVLLLGAAQCCILSLDPHLNISSTTRPSLDCTDLLQHIFIPVVVACSGPCSGTRLCIKN